MADIDSRSVIAAARVIAAAALVRVWEEDAYASPALDAEIRRHPHVDPRDVALATELVYGVLRTQGYLEERIASYSSRHRPPLDPPARAPLYIGAYAIAFLDRVPVFAAVSEAVSGVTQATDSRVGGFANAVLRRFAEEVEAKPPTMADAIVAGAPGWLRGALRRSLGRAEAHAYLAAGPVPPPLGVALANPDEREAWLERLRERLPRATVELGAVSPHAITMRAAGDVRRIEGAEQDWIIQEEGSQVVALALGAAPGEVILDACAGRGNKAWLLSKQVGASGAVDVADLYPAKLSMLSERGSFVRASYAIDWSQGVGEVPVEYDRALVDAPCSGVGTLRRRPEIASRRDPESIAQLASLQVAIAQRVATRVRTGGRLVYAVCSVLREEAEEVVARLVSERPYGVTLEPCPFDGACARALAGEEPTLRLLPHKQGTDGYFMASFIVRR